MMSSADETAAFDFLIPRPAGDPMPIHLRIGGVLFVMGANGTGKSSLMHRLYRENFEPAVRITAHRRTWLSSSVIDMTARQKQQSESQMRQSERNPQFRWRSDYDEQRPGMAIFNLTDSENSAAREIADAMRAGNEAEARRLAQSDSPLARINSLLRSSNLPVTIAIEPGEEILAQRDGADPYSMAEMSDGERNAVLIAADVLTAKPGTLFLVDEPERHLHRSIITPLLSSLFTARRDCSFVVSTHEIGLPGDFAESQVLLLRDCEFRSGEAAAWDADLLEASQTLDEQLQRDVLGARRRILFVEGRTATSLDQPLYSLMFPDVSVIAKGGQGQVIHSVKGLRSTADITWIEAFGIVDHDNRSDDDVSALREQGVYALPWYSVESIYYHPHVQEKVAARRAELLGGNAESAVRTARASALTRVRGKVSQIIHSRASAAARGRAQQSIPAVVESDEVLVLPSIDVPTIRDEERSILEAALDAEDLATIVERYPIRETGALAAIAQGLGFRSCPEYEQAVLRLLTDDEGSLRWVRSLLEPLASDLAPATV